MSSSDEAAAGQGWLRTRIGNWPEPKLVLVLTLGALALRLYLTFSSFCISGDGVEYVRMAREFAAGHPAAALASVFSPLYPWLISLLHRALADWELAGDLISAAFGTATVPLLYLLMREVYRSRAVAGGAAGLAAIHPALAGYSAAVRTEAGFICLMVGAVYLLLGGIERRSAARVLSAGVIGGLAYLYRAEAIGLLAGGVGFLLAGVIIWRKWNLRQGLGWALALGVTFLVLASPYLVYLRLATGHWIASRELNMAASASVMKVAANRAPWEALGQSGNTSLLAPLTVDPRVYLYKVGYELAMSPYYFVKALAPLLFVFLVVGLGLRGRGLFQNWTESFLALLVAFYLCGFALFNTGPRFMVHLVPYTLGWVMLGLEACSRRLGRFGMVGERWAEGALIAVVALVLLPRTLWPLGYDIRVLRDAGTEIARRRPAARGVVSQDNRVAYYAGVKFIARPPLVGPGLCGWLEHEPDADYLMLSRPDERRIGDLRHERCLSLVKRYPGTDRVYYDLFQVRRD